MKLQVDRLVPVLVASELDPDGESGSETATQAVLDSRSSAVSEEKPLFR